MPFSSRVDYFLQVALLRAPAATAAIRLALLEETDAWKQRADPQRRERIGQFLGVIQAEWLIDQLTGKSNSG